MKKKLNWFNSCSFFSFLFFLIFIGCKKPTERSCFKTSGKEITKTLVKGDFTNLILHPYVTYELIQDSINYVEISCGENLFTFIDVQVQDSALKISNNNTCRFLRGYDKNVKAKIHINLLYNIDFDGTEDLYSNDTIKASYCTIKMRDAGGNINLKLKSKELYVSKSNSSGKLALFGKTNKARYQNSTLNIFDVSQLHVKDSIFFLNQGYGDMYLYTNLIDVFGRIEGKGNVFHYGEPALTQIELLGNGHFIEYKSEQY
jgi:hypothetical protein